MVTTRHGIHAVPDDQSHLRFITDFTWWNGQVVISCNETSVQGNPYAGQPQSNLWFGSFEELAEWGPKTGYGSVWVEAKRCRERMVGISLRRRLVVFM